MGWGRGLLVSLGLAAGAFSASAQDAARFPIGDVQSSVLVIEFDRAFSESDFGKRISVEIQALGAEIAAENRRIETELSEEEQRLTDLRSTMSAEDFHRLADDFDTRVQELRQAQDAKARALGSQSEESRRLFLSVAQPVLRTILQERGAAVILERRTVFASITEIDITNLAIARINSAIGDGSKMDQP